MDAWLKAALGLVLGVAAGCSVPEVKAPFRPTTWSLWGMSHDAYRAALDPQMPRNGHATTLLEPIDGAPVRGYATLARQIDARPLDGKHVRFTAYIRTAGVTRRGDFWARVQGPSSPPDGPGLGGGSRTLPPNSAWERYEIAFDVPIGGVQIEYGVGIGGPGRLWVADVTFATQDAAPNARLPTPIER